jgi:hypothetical protein
LPRRRQSAAGGAGQRRYSVFFMALNRLLLAGALAAAAFAQPGIVLHGDPRYLAFDPTSVDDASGSLWYAWNAYRDGRERIFGGTLRNGRLARTIQLSPGAGVYSQPVLVSARDSVWCFWIEQSGGRWRLLARQHRAGMWQSVVPLAEDALMPAAAAHGGRIVVAWEDHSANPQRIALRVWDGAWSEIRTIAGGPAYRPALSAAGGSIWTAWDSYDGRNYSVWSARVWPDAGTPRQLSPPGRNCLKPSVASAGERPAFAWVATDEVSGGAGVLDHADTIQFALLDGAIEEVADLRFGLLPRIDPAPDKMSGYGGRRRHPMLASADDSVWLLWERRAIHDGAAFTTGQLCAREWRGGRWTAPLAVHDGLVDYRIPTGARVRNGSLTVLGKNIHHIYSANPLDLRKGSPLQTLEWAGWKPAKLPLPQWLSPRPSIELDGKTYRLYWGDLHVHTALTPDAEGEVDELMHFARDKVKLDVVVMQENDVNTWMDTNPAAAFRNHALTESDYALSVYFSRRYTERGRFVALPGWEWSDRTEDNKPNHRTVIFAGEHTPIVRSHENQGDFNELCEMVEAAGGLMNTQHEVYRLVDRPCDANIEVAAGWGIYIENPAKIHADLSSGFRVGFVATGDAHRRNPGTGGGITGIYARELTPEAVLEALRGHRVYATNGSRVFLDARANGVFMGQDVRTNSGVELKLTCRAPRNIAKAVLIRDGSEIHSLRGSGTGLEAVFRDAPGAGFHWYYWRIELEGAPPGYPGNMKVAEGHLAWTSPHRVHASAK